MMHLLLPMSGQGTRYQKAGHRGPKPLIDVGGRPMIERVLEVFPPQWPSHCILADNHVDTPLPALLRRLRPHVQLHTLPPHQEGPGRALEVALEHVPDDAPVFVSYCDYGMVWDPQAFVRMVEQSGCDAALVSYRGFHPHYLGPTKYAYSRLAGQRVVEVREKGNFTADRQNEYASTGGYYFREARLLRAALAHQRSLDLRVRGELYTSLTVQALLLLDPAAYVRVFEVPFFFQWGTPDDLKDFEAWERAFAADARAERERSVAGDYDVAQVLMPMAGAGSRFAGVYPNLAKPLIPLGDAPLFRRALASLPAARDRQVLVVRARDEAAVRQHLEAAPEDPPCTVLALDETPPGQALSTPAGLAHLDQNAEVLVSACDHGVVLPPARWRKFIASGDCDVAIFAARNVPQAARDAFNLSYVATASPPGDGDHFPGVTEVSVKQPLSDNPRHDPVVVGTFWFRQAKLLAAGIAALIAADLRTGGELTLDAVPMVLQRMGYTVRMVPVDGFLNWGDPQAYDEARYWQEALTGLPFAPRRGASRAHV